MGHRLTGEVHTTQPGICHNPAQQRWELRDSRNVTVASVADEYLATVPAGLWAAAPAPIRAIAWHAVGYAETSR